MVKHLSLLVITISSSIIFLVEAAYAQQTLVAYVSGKGTDSGICDNPSSPCRTFQYALNHIIIYGEIKALDPANYGPVTIDRSVSITGVDGAGIYSAQARGVGIVIERGAAPVRLTRLTIDGYGHTPAPLGSSGIVINGPGTVTIKDCTIRHFADTGIDIRDSTLGFLIVNTLVAANGRGGIKIASGSQPSIGVLDHVRLHGNGTGLTMTEQTSVMAIDMAATDNNIGIDVEGNGGVWLARSTVTGNAQYGIHVAESRGGVESFGSNDISGNGQDVFGQLTHVDAQ
jgi:hypothetical protein